MFFIFDKQKIYSYLIAASTIVILFILSFFFTNTEITTSETSANTYTSEESNEIDINELQKSNIISE